MCCAFGVNVRPTLSVVQLGVPPGDDLLARVIEAGDVVARRKRN
jgi:hypothetical protein